MGERPAAYRTPEYNKDGTLKGARYFSTATACKEFARKHCRERGGRGWTMDSLSREHVALLLQEHAPLPDYWRKTRHGEE